MIYPSSGIYPLTFNDARPFRSSGVNRNFSSSLEQAIWSINTDLNRFGQSFIFISYQHPSGTPGLDATYPLVDDDRTTSSYRIYEASISGLNFANTNINTTDIINDMRYALSGTPDGFFIDGLLTLHSFDATDDMLKEWLGQVSYDGGGSGLINNRTWTHPYFTGYTPPVKPYLGYSGQLFDIDFDEVFYHPIPRLSSSISESIASSGSPPATFGVWPVSPIFPCFLNQNGEVVGVTSYEALAKNSSNYSIEHVASGYLRIDGDVLLPSGIYNSGGNLCTFYTSGIRNNGVLTGGYHPQISRAYILHPIGTSYPSKRSNIFYVSNPYVYPSSGQRVSRLPAIDNEFEYTKRRPRGFNNEKPFGDGPYGPSGVEYFDDCIGIPTSYIPSATGPYYGVQFLSPVSAYPVWVRLGSGVNWGSQANYQPDQIITDQSAVRINDSTILSFQGEYPIAFGNDGMLFAEYNNSLEIQNHYLGEHVRNLGVSPVIGRIWNNGSTIFSLLSNLTDRSKRYEGSSITTISGVVHQFTYPTFGDAVWYNSNNVHSTISRRSCVGFNDGTDNYIAVSKSPLSISSPNDWDSCSGFSRLSLISGPGGLRDNLYDYGEFEPIVSNDPTLHLPVVPLAVARITGGTSFTNGIWMIFRSSDGSTGLVNNLNGTVYLGRITRISGEWVIQEFYAEKKIPITIANSVPDSFFAIRGSDMHFLLRMDV